MSGRMNGVRVFARRARPLSLSLCLSLSFCLSRERETERDCDRARARAAPTPRAGYLTQAALSCIEEHALHARLRQSARRRLREPRGGGSRRMSRWQRLASNETLASFRGRVFSSSPITCPTRPHRLRRRPSPVQRRRRRSRRRDLSHAVDERSFDVFICSAAKEEH